MIDQFSDVPSSAVRILLVEDDDIDVEAVHRSFRRRRIANEIVVARDGLEALAHLRAVTGHALERPFVVLLDINMPRMNGLEFLREIRSDPALCDLVVFVLTTSDNQNDIFEAYNLNVAGYMLKSDVGDSFTEAIRLIDHYWRVVELRT